MSIKDKKTGRVINCKICGKEKYKEPWQLKKYNNHFCSQSCFAKWMGKQMTGTKRPQEEKDRISKTMKIWHIKHPEVAKKQSQAWLGNKNPAFIDGRTPQNMKLRNNAKYIKWAKFVKERDDYTCRKCGGQHKKKRKIHAHHTPFSVVSLAMTKFEKYIYDVRNGITLCVRCHLILENKIRLTHNAKKINN